jgi:hypothetical protein
VSRIVNVNALRFYAAQGYVTATGRLLVLFIIWLDLDLDSSPSFQPDEIDPTHLRRLERAEKSGVDLSTADTDWVQDIEPQHPDDLLTDYRILSLNVEGKLSWIGPQAQDTTAVSLYYK